MKFLTLILAIIILWGLWGFLDKLAIQKIGFQVSFWNALALVTVILLFLLVNKELLPIRADLWGISLGLIAGVASGLASVLFYILLGKNPVGFLVAITALYPLVTIILSVFFLHETLNVTKIIGIVLALGALLFLNL